ncbi:hypothetical protein E05_47680 [Plautia stali symbiont]|nr:hypothetical protein E05_05780 [Plautia stali symbiont]BAN97799.1 hypothetical protein E05_30330 [Plautia stali symbiont]BAN99534.1 hypothetical protein E05_47680 [Plautia stali symbiont]
MNPILTERILAIAQAAEKAGHGGKDAVYQTGCQALGISRATLLRKIKQVSYKPPRRQRVDCGTSALTREEALQISGVMMASHRKNGKRLYSLEQAVNDLRANNLIHAGTSGWIYAEYRFGGETTQNFTDVLINAMQERGGADVLHGVPRILYTDPGCALVSSTLRNLCQTLGIQLIAHKAGNARATGSVEKARDILECHFESGLRFVQVDNIDELNRLVGLWRKKYNRTAIHRRTGMTRTDCWLRITPGQLIKAPPVDVCRELAVSLPENRKVSTHLRVSFRGSEYDVRQVPGICVGDTVQIVRNPWRDSKAQVVMMNENGLEVFCRMPEVAKDDYGFDLNSPTPGESFRALPHTTAQHHLAEVGQTLYGNHHTGGNRCRAKSQGAATGRSL